MVKTRSRIKIPLPYAFSVHYSAKRIPKLTKGIFAGPTSRSDRSNSARNSFERSVGTSSGESRNTIPVLENRIRLV